MKSWKGPEKGTTAIQPGDADTKLGAGGPIGKGRAPNGCSLPAQKHDTKNVDQEYKLPINDVQHNKEFKNFPGVSEQKFITMDQLTSKDMQKGYIEGVTEYWHESLTGNMGKPGNG